MLDNKVTALGCEFISKAISPSVPNNIICLKLDHNPFGSDGVAALAQGLNQNSTITHLSLTYCNIDEKGADPLFTILIYRASKLEELLLTGNHLRDAGIIKLLRGLSVAKSLKKINLADNQFYEEDDVLEAFESCMKKNQVLGSYNIKYNYFSDDGVTFLMGVLAEAKHVFDV